MKKKIEIINLELGIEPTKLTIPPVLNQETANKIDELIQNEVKEQNVEQKEQKIIEQQQKEDITDKCLHLLLESRGNGIPSEELVKLSNNNLSSLILRLNNLIKKRGALWKIKKKRVQGKTFYIILTP